MVPDPDEGLWDFRFEPPADFTWREELVPIDTRGRVWRAPELPEFGISLDGYAAEQVRCTAAPCRSWQEPLAGAVATITRDAWLNPAEGIAGTLNIHLPLIRRRGHVTLALVVIARCSTRATCDRALEVARTIRVVRHSGP